MKYAVEVASCGMIYIQSFIKSFQTFRYLILRLLHKTFERLQCWYY
jgi:hypothetical protein